jgi:hypothetical protein
MDAIGQRLQLVKLGLRVLGLGQSFNYFATLIHECYLSMPAAAVWES